MAASALLLTHGAGGDRDHRVLIALEEGLDLPVWRMDFPYRREGRRAPDRAPKLVAALREEVEVAATSLGVDPTRMVLGGRSMGGRICSMAVAEGLPAAGLVLLSYPLHPPGKPEKLRTDHFPDVAVPTLFVNGDRDPFGSPEELAAHVDAIAGPTTVHWLAGQRHDPKPDLDEEIVATVGAFLAGL
jgi:predicted alpha/beta-hydrolase family hydrolase